MAQSDDQKLKARKAEALRANLQRRKAVGRQRDLEPEATSLNYRPQPVGTIKDEA